MTKKVRLATKKVRLVTKKEAVMTKPCRDDEEGWLPDKEYKLSEAIILASILLVLTILMGLVS